MSPCSTTLKKRIATVAIAALLRAAEWANAGAVLPDGRGDSGHPYLIRLHQQLSLVRRQGKVVAQKAIYTGTVQVGHPSAQSFQVVFDTGSAHLILPSASCDSKVCRKKRRYNTTSSQTAQLVNLDGSAVLASEGYDEAQIGFGTGQVTGRFAADQVCLGDSGLCTAATIVMATEMSSSPFDFLDFDGILGLGLPGLAISPHVSILALLAAGGRLPHPRFGFFLARPEGQDSEISIGGHNPGRLADPLIWVPVTMPAFGYWQVEIRGVRIGGRRLDLCADSRCIGILDTGTSHLGVPAPYLATISKELTVPSEVSADCRLVNAPILELELPGINLTLQAADFMRSRLPRGGLENGSTGSAKNFCTPKLSAINLPVVGNDVFILGHVVLHRYYTAYDWGQQRIGFGLARQSPAPNEAVMAI